MLANWVMRRRRSASRASFLLHLCKGGDVTTTRVVFGVLMVALISLVYLHVDQSVTLDYQVEENRHNRDAFDLLAAIAPMMQDSPTMDETRAGILKQRPDALVKISGDTLETEGFAIFFHNNRIVRVGRLGE